MQLKFLMTILAIFWLTGCSSSADHPQKYPQLFLESPKKLLIVVHGEKTVPPELVAAFSKEVPQIAAQHGFQIVDPQALQITEVPALSEADAVLYVDIQHWHKDYSKVLAAEAQVKLEYTLVSAKSEQILWSYQENYHRTHFYLGGDFLSEALYRTFFAMSAVYENQASSFTKKAFADFPELLAVNR